MLDDTSVAFQKKHDIPAKEMAFIDSMAKITAIVSRFQHMFSKIPDAIKRDFAKLLFTTKQELDEQFPLNKGDLSLGEICLLCPDLTEPGEPCTHVAEMRAALLLMAMLRVGPEFDLDGDDDDGIDEQNSGMVQS
jgi:hypothetical protein